MIFSRREPKRAMVVADLDKILTTTIAFNLHGKIRKIKPFTTEMFFKYTRDLGELMSVTQEKTTPQELIDKYFNLFADIVDPIERKDIEDCTQQQIAALFDLVVNSVTGKAHQEDGKDVKKKS